MEEQTNQMQYAPPSKFGAKRKVIKMNIHTHIHKDGQGQKQ